MRKSRGLSPLARGNHTNAQAVNFLFGPIPARAGEPRARGWRHVDGGAYPRSRGGTKISPGRHHSNQGLSPLARGNLCLSAGVKKPLGPIPARAGEPQPELLRADWCRAYPRSRGGTRRCPLNPAPRSGLSPLARGNHLIGSSGTGDKGPIPARAGEPALITCRTRCPGAYPRSRGGTTAQTANGRRNRGLSPLARGNRNESWSPVVMQGPIPARAGEPIPIASR